MFGAILRLFGGHRAATASIWEARVALHASKESYARLAGAAARMRHLLEDQKKGLEYYQLQVDRAIQKDDDRKARVNAEKVIEYRRYVKENQEKLDNLQQQMRELSANIQQTDAKINLMNAETEARQARSGIAVSKSILSEAEVRYRSAAAEADALEEVANLTAHEDLFFDKEYEQEKQQREVDSYLKERGAKFSSQDTTST